MQEKKKIPGQPYDQMKKSLHSNAGQDDNIVKYMYVHCPWEVEGQLCSGQVMHLVNQG